MGSMHTISSVIQLIAALTAAVALLSRSTAAQEVDRLQTTGGKDNVAPFMIVAQYRQLIKMDINGSNAQILLTEADEITAVDFHYRRGLIFYLVGDLAVGLYSYNLFSEDTTGQGEQEGTNLDTERPTGLTVDWINDKVYWIDSKKHTLEVYDIDSGENQMLFRFENEQSPQGLTILPYPNSGWLFVTARSSLPGVRGHTDIYQFSLNDSAQETTIHKDRCGTKITINRTMQKLYWLDTCENRIEESRLDEDCIETVEEVVEDLGLSGGLAEYNNDCYYTQKGKIYQKSLDGSSAELYNAGGSMTLSGLAIVHPSIQPEASQLHPLRNQKDGECPTIEAATAPVSTGTTTILPATTLSPTTEPETVSPTTEELTVSSTTAESTTASPTTEALTTPSPKTDIPTTKVSTTPTATTHSTTTADEATSSPLPTTHSTTTTDETTTVSSSASPISTTEVMTTVTSSESPTESKEHFTTTEKQSTTEVKPFSENPVDGLNRMREEPPSSMVLIVISVCVVLVLLILVASATYLFLVVFKYHRRRRGSYNVRERRRGDESCAPLARNSFRAFTDYHPSVSTRVNQNSHASTLTGSSSVDSFERMSIGSPLVVPCSYQVTEAEIQPAEQVVFAEVTEGEIQPVAAARPEIVQVGSSSSVPTECNKKGPYGCGTLYASEERQMYFSL